ncbi:hypothetical protein [Massilia psychrophila]|nr:hypothetical protein [Massilia psychrophila]GGE83739.1 hypothetical protein GCM10008020_30770 [Massilia psychrophila]
MPLSAAAFVAHLLAVHDKTSNIDLTVYPYDAHRRHMRDVDGRLRPLSLE